MIIIPFVGMIVRNSFRQKEWFLESKIASKGEPRGDQRRPRGGQKEPKDHQNGPREIIPFVGMTVRNSFHQKEWFLESKIHPKGSRGETKGAQGGDRRSQKSTKMDQRRSFLLLSASLLLAYQPSAVRNVF